MNDEAQKLKDLRARRAELAAARVARTDEDELARQIRAEELGIADEEAIAAAMEKFGPIDQKIKLVQTDMGVVIVKKAHPNIYRRFQDSESLSNEELDKLVRPSVVYPPSAQFDALLDELPATLLRCANAISVLAGIRKEDMTKK